MKNVPPVDPPIREAAARWTVRRDRGLSSAEAIEFELWLAADPRHAAAMQRSAAAWSLLDRVPESVAAPVFAAARRRRSFWRRSLLVGSIAAAAAVTLVAYRSSRSRGNNSPAAFAVATAVSSPRQLTLPDGTVVQLNAGSEVIEQFTAAERRVTLARGEAHFAVTRNPARPFLVHAGNLEVCAVGTAFNVRLQSSSVDVLVTEGVVQLDRRSAHAPEENSLPAIPLLNSGQRAVVPLVPERSAVDIVVTNPSPEEITRSLAWQAPLLRLGGATLAELVLEFQRRSGQRVILADPALGSLRVGGRFRGDDLAGFTHLLATTLDLEVDHAADGTLVLRKKTSESR